MDVTVSTSTRSGGDDAAVDLVGDTIEFDSIDNTVSTSMDSFVLGGTVVDDDDVTGNVVGAGYGGDSTVGDTSELDSIENTVSTSMGSSLLGTAVDEDASGENRRVDSGSADVMGDDATMEADSINITVSTSMSSDVVGTAGASPTIGSILDAGSTNKGMFSLIMAAGGEAPAPP